MLRRQTEYLGRKPGSEPERLSKRQSTFLRKALARLGFKSYAQYLVSDEWKETKRRYRASNKPQSCAVCHAPNVDLHHKTYKRLGHERLDDLTPLCRRHHDELHERGLDMWLGIKILRAEERRDIRRRFDDGEAGWVA